MQPHPHPVLNPPKEEVIAGQKFARLKARYVEIQSSAQVEELVIDEETYWKSVAYGFDRPQPKIRLPNGKITRNPGDVPEWVYLHNPQIFNGFGTGIYVRQENGGYMADTDYLRALGGPSWRPAIFEALDRLYPGGGYKEYLGRVDQPGLFEAGEVDVAPLSHRVQFDFRDSKGFEWREKMQFDVSIAQLAGKFPPAVWVDESNPSKGRSTRYLVPVAGPKEIGLERIGNALSFHAGVPMDELEFIKFGDSPTDLASGLVPFQGAKEVTMVLAGGSRLNDCIRHNLDEFAGMPLVGSPNHPDIPGRYYPTETPGVYWWRGPQRRARKVILAEDAPWSQGMPCTQSVYACAKHLLEA